MVKLFIGGFPLRISELELVQLVSLYGTVCTIKMIRDRKTGICKGYAFLEMKTLADATHAVEVLNGRTMEGQTLTLKINPEEPEIAVGNKPYKPKPSDNKAKLSPRAYSTATNYSQPSDTAQSIQAHPSTHTVVRPRNTGTEILVSDHKDTDNFLSENISSPDQSAVIIPVAEKPAGISALDRALSNNKYIKIKPATDGVKKKRPRKV